jgi:predicted TIM-barrel enzyme
MKPAQLAGLNTELPPIEEDLATRLDSIFERCPQLHGFTVQDSSALPEELRSLALERELVVTDIGVYPNVNTEHCEQIYNEIAVALLDFMFERPAAKDVLRGRTFARTLH